MRDAVSFRFAVFRERISWQLWPVSAAVCPATQNPVASGVLASGIEHGIEGESGGGDRSVKVQIEASSMWVGACLSTRRNSRHRRHSRDVQTRHAVKAAMWRRRAYARCGVLVFATREVQSEASVRTRRPPPQSSPVRRETRPAAEPPPVLNVKNGPSDQSLGLNPEAGHNPRQEDGGAHQCGQGCYRQTCQW